MPNAKNNTTRGTTVIVPVYGDWPSLADCIDSLVEFMPMEKTNKVLLVNDCGPDVDMIEANIQAKIKGMKHFEYHRNPENLGFLRNCNRAVFELDGTNNDILLLNSDTKVTEDFLTPLKMVLNNHPTVATVSPRSNNATITTMPIHKAKDKGIEPAKSYELFLRVKDRLPEYNVAPVAHGFCMLIRRSVIDEIGLFDEVFGKGYGEETDFCQRAAIAGYENTISNRAFVYHLEARSFTLETKQQLLSVNDVIINKRYPRYRRQVRDYRLKIEAQEARLVMAPLEYVEWKARRVLAPKLRRIRQFVSSN